MNPCINETFYAWANIPVSTTVLDANIVQMLILKSNYLIDVRHVKNNLVV